MEIDQKESTAYRIEIILQGAPDNQFLVEHRNRLWRLVTTNVDIVQTSSSSDPPTNVEHLYIQSTPDANQILVRSRKPRLRTAWIYGPFCQTVGGCRDNVLQLFSACACALLSAPRARLALPRSTFDLRLDNSLVALLWSTSFPCRILNINLRPYEPHDILAILDRLNGYWKLLLANLPWNANILLCRTQFKSLFMSSTEWPALWCICIPHRLHSYIMISGHTLLGGWMIFLSIKNT